MLNRNNTLASILKLLKKNEYYNTFFSSTLFDTLENFPENVKNLTLTAFEQSVETSTNIPAKTIVNQLLSAAHIVNDIQSNRRQCIQLWNQNETWYGTLDQSFLITPEFECLTSQKSRPALLICPGGGYENICMYVEGSPVLDYFETYGYVVFILKYQVAPTHYPLPQEDVAMGIKYIREHAEKYGINKNQIHLMGFSAGGHLCASMIADHKNIGREIEKKIHRPIEPTSLLPNSVCLGYPVISFETDCHEGSVYALAGSDPILKKKLSLEKQDLSGFPPVFLWSFINDRTVPISNTVRFANALKKWKIVHQAIIYPEGRHGCGLAQQYSASSWPSRYIEFINSLNL